MDDESRESDERAARALLAYFNHDLAGKLLDKVISKSQPAAQRRLADAILELFPKALQETRTFWGILVERVEKQVAHHVQTDAFKDALETYVVSTMSQWLAQAVQEATKAQAIAEVRQFLHRQDGSALLKTIPGRLHAAIEQAIRDAATEAVAAKAKA